MIEETILIGDEDWTYAQALCKYLLGYDPDLKIHYFTDLEEFQINEEYGVGLLSTSFLKKYETMPEKNRIHHILHLVGISDEHFKDYKNIYKFQSMEAFRKVLVKEQWQIQTKQPEEWKKSKRYIGIYSPCSHDLLLPFTLLLGKQFAERERVLIVDMQENSMMLPLLHLEGNRTLVDYIFRLESERREQQTSPILSEFTEIYDGMAILPPVRVPSEIAFITTKEWSDFMFGLRKESFDTILFLFDRMHCGFEEMLLLCDEFLLVGSQGAYQKKREERILHFLKTRGFEKMTKQIYLPQNMDVIGGDNYQMEAFVQGALGKFIRSQYREFQKQAEA